MNKLSIVPVSDIPSLDKIEDVSLDNLMETYKTCLQLRELCEQESGIGIAAVQTGIHQKLFLVNFCAANKKYGYFINCKYEPDGEDKMLHIEGCL
jgi:peptide deformylase